MRKSNYLIQLNYKDGNFCKILKNSHHISENSALLVVSRNRLDSYVKQSILKKLYYVDNNRKEIVFELTKKGRDWISHNFPQLRGNFYTSATAIQHNVTLAKQIMEHSFSPWLNERDLREILLTEIQKAENSWELFRMLENGEISVPDGAFINGQGNIEAIEVINENYTSTMLQSKDNFSKICNIPITYIKQK